MKKRQQAGRRWFGGLAFFALLFNMGKGEKSVMALFLRSRVESLNLIKRLGYSLAFCVFFVTFSFYSFPAWATQDIQSQPYQPQDMTNVQNPVVSEPATADLLLRLFLALVVVAAIGWVAVRFWQKGIGMHRKSTWLNVMDHASLGVGRDIYFVEIGGRFFALGVTNQTIQPITEIQDPNIIAKLQSQQEISSTAPSGFGNLIKLFKREHSESLTERQTGKMEELSDNSFHLEMKRQLARFDHLKREGGLKDE